MGAGWLHKETQRETKSLHTRSCSRAFPYPWSRNRGVYVCKRYRVLRTLARVVHETTHRKEGCFLAQVTFSCTVIVFCQRIMHIPTLYHWARFQLEIN